MAETELETIEMPQLAETHAVAAVAPAVESPESLAERVAAAVDQAAKARRTYEMFVRASLIACIPIAAVLALMQRQVEGAVLVAVFIAVVIGGIGLFMLQAYEKAADRLSAVEEIRTVGALIDLLENQEKNPDRR